MVHHGKSGWERRDALSVLPDATGRGGQTAPILKGLRIAESITNRFVPIRGFSWIRSDAVQVSESERARQDAILTEWGVWPSLAERGRLSALEE